MCFLLNTGNPQSQPYKVILLTSIDQLFTLFDLLNQNSSYAKDYRQLKTKECTQVRSDVQFQNILEIEIYIINTKKLTVTMISTSLVKMAYGQIFTS